MKDINPFFPEDHCEAHATPGISKDLLGSAVSAPFPPSPGPKSLFGSTTGSWHLWRLGAMSLPTPLEAPARGIDVPVPRGHPGSCLSDHGSSLTIVKLHFLGPKLGPNPSGVRMPLPKCRCIPL